MNITEHWPNTGNRPEGYELGSEVLLGTAGAELAGRQNELSFLTDQLGHALPVVGDLERANGLLSTRGADNLVISNRAEMRRYSLTDVVNGTANLNNFLSSHTGIAGVGRAVFGTTEDLYGRQGRREYIGRIPYTREQLDSYFRASDPQNPDGRRGPAQFALARMWILFPELTEHIVGKCLDRVATKTEPPPEESFVAYTVASYLVAEDDPDVIRDGEVDRDILVR